jgi:superoxide dismutase, Fe-Mn family
MTYLLPKLSYEFNSLEPWIDAKTMELHYTKHHQAYLDKLNLILAKYPKLEQNKIEDMMTNINQLPMDDKDKLVFRNAGGGHLNHTFFWSIMGPKKILDNQLSERIINKYGSIDNFKKLMSETALNHFGSGWGWLVENSKGDLEVYSTPNQDSPLLAGHKPLIAIDVWEHAYYLKYQNRRVEYINAWWNVLKLI